MAKTNVSTERETESRVTVPIDASGMIDIERMQGRSRERVAAWFASARVHEQLGIRAPHTTSAPASDVLPDAAVVTVVTTIGVVCGAIVQRVYGCTPEQAALMHFSTPEAQTIAPPLGKVLNKYGSSVLAKYGDELALAAILTTTIANKVGAVQAAIAKAQPPAPVLAFPQSAENQAGHETPSEVN